MLVAEALRAGDDDLLAKAMNDRIHEPYRMQAIPGATRAKKAAIDSGRDLRQLERRRPRRDCFCPKRLRPDRQGDEAGL